MHSHSTCPISRIEMSFVFLHCSPTLKETETHTQTIVARTQTMDRIFLWKPSPIPAEKISLSLLRHWYVKSIVISWFIHYVGFESVSVIMLTAPIVPLTVLCEWCPLHAERNHKCLRQQNRLQRRRGEKSLAARAVKFFLNWRKWTSQCVPAA